MIELYGAEQGICPRCKSDNLKYEPAEFEEDYFMLYFPYTCEDCGLNGQEWYELTYDGMNVEEDSIEEE